MALSRFVLTANVTLTPDALAAVVAGEPGTGGPAGFGNSATIIPSALSQGKYGLPGMPLTFLAGTTIYADSAAGFATGAQLLYQAIGAGNLRAYVQGQDDVGHAALANLTRLGYGRHSDGFSVAVFHSPASDSVRHGYFLSDFFFLTICGAQFRSLTWVFTAHSQDSSPSFPQGAHTSFTCLHSLSTSLSTWCPHPTPLNCCNMSRRRGALS